MYVLNKLPTRALSKLTPYEMWTGKKPHLEHIKVFGCLGYMKIPAVHLKKHDDRSKPVVYLGKETGTKAFRLYDPVEGTVQVNRDVHFEKQKGWSLNEGETENVHSSSVFTVIGHQSNTQGEYVNEEDSEGNLNATPSFSSADDSSNGSNSGDMSDVSDSSSEPRRLRQVSSIYDETEEVEAADELLLSEVAELVTYEQAVKDKA